MNISRLTITDFRSYTKAALDLEPMTVIRSQNGIGKSSIQMAIEMLLTGRCAVTDGAGRGSTALIRDGAKELQVAGLVHAGGESTHMRLRLNAAGSSLICDLGDNKLADNAAGGWIAEAIAPKEVLSAVLSSTRFLQIKEDEQRDLLAAILLPTNYEFEPAVMELLKGMSFQVTASDLSLIQKIDLYYDLAFKRRTEVNRELRDLKAAAAGEPAEMQLDVEEERRNLEMARVELRKQQKLLDETLAPYNAAKQTIEQAATRRRELESAIELVKLNLGAAEPRLIPESRLRDLRKVAKQKAKAQDLDGKLQVFMQQSEAAVTALTKAANIEGANESRCPTCKQAVSETLLMELLRPLIESRDHAERNLRQAEKERKEIGDWKEAESLVERHDAAAKDIESLKKSLQQGEADLVKLDAPPDAERPDTTELGARIATLEADVARYTDRFGQASRLREKMLQWERAKQRTEALDGQLVKLERLLKYFGSSGLKSALLTGRVGQMNSAINETLRLWGYAARIGMEPYMIEVSHADKPFLQLKQLSESQQYRFAVAFQIALAHITNVRFVVVDRADILDAESRGILYHALNAADLLDQAIMLATSEYKPGRSGPEEAWYYLTDSPDGVQVEKQFQGEVAA